MEDKREGSESARYGAQTLMFFAFSVPQKSETREEETLRSIAAGYVLPADATAEARAQRKAALDRLRENVRRAHGLYIREITVVR